MSEQTFEEWRPVVGYKDVYEVSNHGRIRRVGKATRHGKGRGGGARIGLVLKQQVINGGYLHVQLSKDGHYKNFLISRLVAIAFLSLDLNGRDVHHRDGNKHNNHLDNLEYMTRSDNNCHAYRTGLRAVTVEQMARARRKQRLMIPCACGCGTEIETPDRKGRNRHYVRGHNMRRVS